MRKMPGKPVCRLVCWYLVLFLSGAVLFPGTVRAAFVSPSEGALAGMDGDVLSSVTLALEDELLSERLSRAGLSSEEIKARLESLSPDERQAVLDQLESLQAGGDGGIGTLVSLAVLILLVILIVKLLNKEIIIK
ncbi:MAG: PA2779 family protein [Proteobacteria bacterium]|nr:PA2779 family protein [Pseudomonadota bacterium]